MSTELMQSARTQNYAFTADNPRWMDDAPCASVDPDLFFPEMGGSTRQAKRICMTCELRQVCLAYAIEHDEIEGVWGGLSPNQRRKLRKEEAA